MTQPVKISTFFIVSALILFFNTHRTYSQTKWYKGNTHTHTTYSNGEFPIKEVVGRYISNR